MTTITQPFELTFATWDSLNEADAVAVVRDVERRVPRARFARFEDHGRRVAVFDVGGIEMVLVPGGRARLGFDVELLDDSARLAWDSSFEEEGHAAQQILGGPDVGKAPPADLIAALRDAMTAPREVEVRAFLLERTSERDVEIDDDDDPHVAMAKAVVAEGFRLPTSDEWEHASAAGRRTLFRWGNRWPVDTDVYHGGAFEEHAAPNALGLIYRTDPYHAEIVDDPWELRAGDGGCLVCGGSGPISWMTFASAFRYRLKASDSRDIWFEQTHPRRALSITPLEGEGAVRPFVPRTVFDDADLAIEQLTSQLDGGDLEELPDLEALGRSHPDNARVFVCIAHAYRKLGKLERAEEAARSAISMSKSVGPLTTLGDVLAARGDIDAAGAAFEEAISLQPSNDGPYASLAEVLRGADRFAEAADVYRRLLEQKPGTGYARVWQSYCLFRATADDAHARALVEIARGPAKGVAWIAALADEIAPGWQGEPN